MAARLRARRAEVEHTILACIRAAPDRPGQSDAECQEELRATVAAVVDYGLAGIEQSEQWHARQRVAERVKRLLAGESVDLGDVDYELNSWHLGVMLTGVETVPAVQELAAGLDCQVLSVQDGEETIWGWLGGQRRLTASDIDRVLPAALPSGISLVAGEPGQGVEGFRCTHSQAQAALRVALRRPQKLTRYADVALLASALQDDVLARWLIETYLSPFGEGSDRGMLRRTLRAYFAAERSVAAAASELGVVPRTIKRRLRTVEEKLGRQIQTCQAELEVALCLEEFDQAAPPAG